MDGKACQDSESVHALRLWRTHRPCWDTSIVEERHSEGSVAMQQFWRSVTSLSCKPTYNGLREKYSPPHRSVMPPHSHRTAVLLGTFGAGGVQTYASRKTRKTSIAVASKVFRSVIKSSALSLNFRVANFASVNLCYAIA